MNYLNFIINLKLKWDSYESIIPRQYVGTYVVMYTTPLVKQYSTHGTFPGNGSKIPKFNKTVRNTKLDAVSTAN